MRKLYTVSCEHGDSFLENLKIDSFRYADDIHPSAKMVFKAEEFVSSTRRYPEIGVYVENLVPEEQEKLAIYLRGWLDSRSLKYLYYSHEQSERWAERIGGNDV